jgi:hypothetical protein
VGAPNFQPAMSIVVAATQMAVTRVILRIANLLPRPDPLAVAPASWRSIPLHVVRGALSTDGRHRPWLPRKRRQGIAQR